MDTPQTVELGEYTLQVLAAIANPGMSPGDWIALGIGLLQCALIAWGLRMMKGNNEERMKQSKALETQTKALQALLERTAK